MTKELHQAVSQVLIHEWPCGTVFRGLPAKCLLLPRSAAGQGLALSSGALAQLSSVPMLPSMRASIAHWQADTCHCINVPPPNKPCVSFPLLVMLQKEQQVPPNPQGIKRPLGLPCPHKASYLPLPPSLLAALSSFACLSPVPAGQ